MRAARHAVRSAAHHGPRGALPCIDPRRGRGGLGVARAAVAALREARRRRGLLSGTFGCAGERNREGNTWLA